jgi:hypothetical protein
MRDYKQRIMSAMTKHHERQLKVKRKNNAPEKAVEFYVMTWCLEQGWSLDVVEARGADQNPFGTITVRRGFSDLCGCDDDGHAVYVELKAPGKLSTLREHQRDFLIEKIKHNAFAVCVDSPELLEEYYTSWRGVVDKQGYLLGLI